MPTRDRRTPYRGPLSAELTQAELFLRDDDSAAPVPSRGGDIGAGVGALPTVSDDATDTDPHGLGVDDLPW